MKSNSPSICPRCGAAFSCGMNDAQKPCWCASLPPLAKTLPDAACYCPDCLQQLVAVQEKEAANS